MSHRFSMQSHTQDDISHFDNVNTSEHISDTHNFRNSKCIYTKRKERETETRQTETDYMHCLDERLVIGRDWS